MPTDSIPTPLGPAVNVAIEPKYLPWLRWGLTVLAIVVTAYLTKSPPAAIPLLPAHVVTAN